MPDISERDKILDEAIKAVLAAEPQADVGLTAGQRELAQQVRRASCFRIACLKDGMPAHIKRALAWSDIPS